MIAAPTAAPKKPSSAIGVLSIRSGNSCSSPRVTVNAAPSARHADIFTQTKDGRIALHFLEDAAQGFGEDAQLLHIGVSTRGRLVLSS